MQARKTLATVVSTLALIAAPLAGKTDRQKTVHVDCAKGQSIQKALEDKAEQLIVEIRGVCHEDVVVERPNVTLRGSDPALDGIRGVGPSRPGSGVVVVQNTRDVRLENLSVGGGSRYGLSVIRTTVAEVSNCHFLENAVSGVLALLAFVDITDSVFTANRDAIAGFDAELIRCTHCTGTSRLFGILAVGGSRLGIQDSSFSAGSVGVIALEGAPWVELTNTNIAGDDLSLWATEDADIVVRGGELQGSILAEQKSLLILDGTQQTAQTFGQNRLDLGTIARLTAGATLLGPVSVEAFANLAIQGGSIAGDLTCSAAGDAFCADPSAISGSVSGCASCAQPPPCATTAGAEYVISGGTDPDAGIFVDDILRVFVSGGLVGEVSQGGRCCPPAAPIRFVADTGDTLRVQAQDANDCYSLEALWLQKADGSCLTQLTGDIFGPNCGAEPPEQVFFDETFTLP